MKNVKGILIGSAVMLGVIGILIIVIIVLRKRGKSVAPAVLPKQTNWGSTLTDAESAQIKRLADALYQDLKGIAWNRNENVYIEYAQTSDRVFVGVANYFAEQYGDGETLYDWIDSEWWLLTGKYKTGGVIDSIKMRLLSFNLK